MHRTLALLATVALFSGAAAAAEDQKQVSPSGAALEQREAPPEREQITMQLEFAQLDQNGDGTVSQEEYQKVTAEHWQQADRDDDGTIDEAEFAAFIYNVQGREPTGADTMMGGGDGVAPN